MFQVSPAAGRCSAAQRSAVQCVATGKARHSALRRSPRSLSRLLLGGAFGTGALLFMPGTLLQIAPCVWRSAVWRAGASHWRGPTTLRATCALRALIFGVILDEITFTTWVGCPLRLGPRWSSFIGLRSDSIIFFSSVSQYLLHQVGRPIIIIS